jgi:hypothetical protein
VQLAVVVQTGLAAMVLVEVLQLVARMELQAVHVLGQLPVTLKQQKKGYLI